LEQKIESTQLMISQGGNERISENKKAVVEENLEQMKQSRDSV